MLFYLGKTQVMFFPGMILEQNLYREQHEPVWLYKA
jgi:hypothetical protein